MIEVRNVHKRYRSTVAVDDLSFSVPKGVICGFLGPNGAGKSTTIRMIMSIVRPDRGSIQVLGSDAWLVKDRIGYLPEERGVYRKMLVRDFLAYMGKLKGADAAGLKAKVARWLDRVELPHVATHRCEDLSKGMQQKIQFAAALVHEPELVILDEPFSGLDPVNADVLRDLVLELKAEGRTVLFSTHVLQQAEQLCDRFVLLDRGQKLLDATLNELRTTYDPRTVRVEWRDGTDPSGLSGVARAEPEGSAWALRVAEGVDPQAVLQAAATLGPVRRLEIQQATVEDVFRQHVRRQE